MVAYDWVLISGQELELIWSQRWSLVTVLYLSVRFFGVIYCGTSILWNILSVPVTDTGCTILWVIQNCIPAVVMVMLGIVMIIRLHAMYLGSRKMLIFLIVVSLALMIVTGVILTVASSYTRGEEFVLSGMYQCDYIPSGGNVPLLINNDWMLVTALTWEVLTLSLAIWIAIKHFHELRQQSTRWNVKDCFTVLIKTHVFYFAAFVLFSCFTFSKLSPKLRNISTVGIQLYGGVIPVLSVVQLFVLGPRLILDIRAYNAQVLVNSDEGTVVTTIVFHERTYELTANSDV